MDARDEKARQLEQTDRAIADERDVEVARPRTFGIERRLIAPAISGERAAAQHNRRPWRNRFFDRRAERSEQFGPAAKCEPDDVVALLLLGRLVLFAQRRPPLRPPLRMGS